MLKGNKEESYRSSESINSGNLSSRIHHRHNHSHRMHGNHSQANCLFFVDPCTSLELAGSTSYDKTGSGLPGLPGPSGHAVHLPETRGI